MMLRSPIARAMPSRSSLREHSAGRVLRRIQDDELGPVVDQPAEFVDINPKIHLLAQLDRHGFRAEEIDHRLVNRKSGIRVDDLISFFNQRQKGEEDDGLAARDNDHFFGCCFDPARLTHSTERSSRATAA